MSEPLLRSQCYVDGRWIGGADVAVTNPATGQTIASVPRFGADEAHDAIAAAKAAFPAWSKLLAKQRSAILRRWFDLVVARGDELARILTTEQGKPLAEAKAEVTQAGTFIEFYAEEAKRLYGETVPSHIADGRIIVTPQPVGVVAAITPWNFPASMITRKAAPALAAGCTMVLKPAGETPLTAFALAALAEEAGVPPGVFNVISGNSQEIGKVMCASPDVRTLTFTGSTPIGKVLMQQCAATVKKVGMELGGNAPFIVFDDADVDAAVAGAMASKYRNAGQTCVCANRTYVQDGIYATFAAKMAQAAAELSVGDGLADGTQQGPLINADAVAKVEEHIQDAVAKGAKITAGGDRHSLGGTFFQPTVLTDVDQSMAVAKEETFGPVAPLFRFKTEEDVIAMANDTEFGLASYFYANDLGRVWRVAEALEYGMVAINTGLIATEVAPFGGVKESGIGREGSRHGMEEFVELKYMLMAGI